MNPRSHRSPWPSDKGFLCRSRFSLRNIGVDTGWLATFQRDPLTGAVGFATAPTPWLATQEAAWRALRSNRG
jgi:hypothetical protein